MIMGGVKAKAKMVEANTFIERLKKMRALDPSSLRFDKDGRRVKSDVFSDIKILLKAG